MVVEKMAALTEAQVATAATVVTQPHSGEEGCAGIQEENAREQKKAFTPTPTTVNGGSSWETKSWALSGGRFRVG